METSRKLTKVVRHAGERNRHVPFGGLRPHAVLDVAVSAYDGEARDKGVVEPSGADDGIELDDLARFQLYALSHHAAYTLCDDFRVGGSESFQVARGGCYAAGAERELRYQGFT